MSEPARDAPLDVVVLVARRWKTLAACMLLATGAAIAYLVLAPKWYAATLTVVPSQRTPDSAATTLIARLPGGLDTTATDVQRIHAVLTSNSVADEVIAKFSLKQRYGTDHLEKARAALWDHCGTSVDRRSGVVALTCEDEEPAMAQAMARYFGEIGNKVFGRVSVSSAREERKFLEAQVTKSRADVDAASRKLREFQERHKIVDLPEQSKAVISAMASIKGELLSKQLELSYLSSFAARTESSVVQLQQQIGIMERKLAQLETANRATPPPANGSAGRPADFFPGAMSVPELRFELEQLVREQKIQETVFFLMTQRYEMSKIDEARDTSTFQILDSPTLPSYPTRPARKRTLALGGLGGLALAIAWIVGPAWWRRRLVSGA